ncbi:MAG: LysR family transcriptional regulator [Pseudomonadota bacterium]
MNLRDLEYVEAIASHRNFSRAANACNVSQPALSIQIKKLESELGAELFERRNHEVLLTEFGKRILESAEQINRHSERIREIALEYRNLDATPFKIGMTSTLAPYLTKYVRDMMTELYPSLRVVLVEHRPVNLAEMVEKKEVDVALIARKSHELIYGTDHKTPMNFTSIWQEPLYLGVRKGHPLTRKDGIFAKDVPEDMLIRFKIPFGYGLEKDLPETSANMLEKTGFDVSAARFETVCRHVSYSDDCTIINAIAVEQFRHDNWDLDYIPFKDEGNLRDLGMTYRPGYPRRKLLQEISRYISKSPPGGVIPVSEPVS